MAYFAKLDSNYLVENTYVIDDSNATTEANGIAFCVSLYGEGIYKQFWQDGSQRARGAAKGSVYNVSKDVFHAPKAFDSFVWSDEDKEYIAPIAKPSKDLSDRPYPYTDTDTIATESIEDAVTRLFFEWDESRGTWVATEFTTTTRDGDTVPDPTGNTFSWNSTTSEWDAI
jgi:hypothetical protein